MRRAMTFLAALAGPGLAALPAAAEGDLVRAHEMEAAYEDVQFDLRIAIESRGLVIDSVSHVGAMLNRTAADVGAETQVYDHAEVMQFCSAIVSRSVIEADPLNLAYCPYGVFIYQLAGGEGAVTIGYRRFPEGEMQEVEALLEEIVREVAGLD